MDNHQNEEKVSIKENLKSLDKQTKKTLFNAIVVSICGLFFIGLIVYLALTQPTVLSELVKPTMIGPIMPPIVYSEFLDNATVEKVSIAPKLEHPIYRGEKVEYVHPIYRGEPVEFTLLSNK